MPDPLDIVLLPGLDGTGRLFRFFVDALPAHLRAHVVAYRPDVAQSHAELAAYVEALIPRDRPFAIVAESFSGPVAIRIAAQKPKGLVALVLVGTFVRQPIRFVPAWVAPLVGRHLFYAPPPAWISRRLVAGRDATDSLMAEADAAWRRVKPAVLASRLRESLRVNVVDDFRAVAAPMLYLAGTRDRLVSPSTADALAQLRPGLAVARLDAPHFILPRRPAED